MALELAYERSPVDKIADVRTPGLGDLVETIGLDDFGNQMRGFFDRIVGADHCTAYQMRNYELTEVLSSTAVGARGIPDQYLSTYDISRHFRQMGHSRARVEIYDLPKIQGTPFTTLFAPQAILILGSRMDSQFCVRVLRMSGQERLPDYELWQLNEMADLIISVVARHQDLSAVKSGSFTALASLSRIEERILSTKSLSRREGEVCARILFGYSSCSIAVDLGIGKESVMTYRKRAYQHLGIGSQRELLMWYLEQVPDAVCN